MFSDQTKITRASLSLYLMSPIFRKAPQKMKMGEQKGFPDGWRNGHICFNRYVQNKYTLNNAYIQYTYIFNFDFCPM